MRSSRADVTAVLPPRPSAVHAAVTGGAEPELPPVQPAGTDWWLVSSVLLLAAFGLVMAFSASIFEAVHRHGSETFFLHRHIAWLGVGLVAFLTAAHVPYQRLARSARPILLAAIGMLLLLRVDGVGVTVNNATRWLQLGPLRFQPGELAKVAFAIYLARSLAEKSARNAAHTFTLGIAPPMMVWVLLFGLFMMQPDFGSGVVLGALLFVMTFVAGARFAYLLVLGGGGITAAITFVMHDPMRSKRFAAFLEPLKYQRSTAYQLFNGLLAVGNGGVFGRGLGGSHMKLGFVPEAHTDFVLAIIGEELGLVGIAFVASMYIFICIRGLRIALNAPCEFGRLLGVGLTSLVGIHAAINFGVVMGMLPTKGLTLPLVSYGGSSLVIFATIFGVLVNIGRGGRPDPRAPRPGDRQRSRQATRVLGPRELVDVPILGEAH